jgi:hypothetical protein
MKHYNGPNNLDDYADNLLIDPSGNVYVTGHSNTSNNNYDWATIKYNGATGDSLWVRRYNGSGNNDDRAYLISIDSGNNNIYVGGYSNEGAQGQNATMIKYSTSGVQQWVVSYDSTNGNGYYTAIALDAQNNLYALASQQINSPFYSLFTFKYSQSPGGIHQISSNIPNTYSLNQNYPNPFNPSTVIKFQVPNSGFVKLSIYDILGREISTLVNEELHAGTYQVDFDGSKFASGVYFYRLVVGDNTNNGRFVDTKKMVLVK